VPATPRETSVVEHEVRIAASPETVFGYFTDPARLVQWMGAEATLDPRPGGVCRIVFRPIPPALDILETSGGRGQEQRLDLNGTNVVLGRFEEVDPYSRIVFTWGFEREPFAMPPGSSSVEVSLTPDGEDTILRLAHRRLPSDATAFHRVGWEHYLPRLVTVVTGGKAGADSFEAPPTP
jgi:uncharacterized protein YndB with AHSA1/START domain